MAQLQQGSVIWAEVPDQNGKNPKTRALVVLTRTEEIEAGKKFVAVAISSEFNEPLEERAIPMPWKKNRHPVTRLYEPSVAVCNWLVSLDESQVVTISHRPIETRLLLQIMEQVSKCS
ncbi:MAG TPA: hypothetical protein VGH74_16050 [Planctomycetaceae bacterium]